ncbi:hypothetical protein OO015_06010 [Thermomicrobium sp. 4228-Ro]|uniref:hypothetical protein n=1 Tax=Thermomicrobium sp. 4228-Ro TaxID=2993937 RepID=UPI0022495866|nr:hypothetical protein [Thermomicrobium sp. 4228-Ro]MCX2727050.1 hypothetical protein [Thermomicrobium sp. 4228-Ro]
MVRRIVLLLVVLVLSACSLPQQPTPTPLPPTPTPVPEGTPALSPADQARVTAWADAWATVQRFRAEITAYDTSGTLRQRLELAVVLPDRLHAIQYDPASGQPAQEWIIVGDAGWIRSGDRWQLGQIQQSPDFASLYDPAELAAARTGAASVTIEELPSETIDGVICEKWAIIVTPAGQKPNQLTLWIGQADQLPRQLRTEYADGSVLVLRYWGFDESFTIEPPGTSEP